MSEIFGRGMTLEDLVASSEFIVLADKSTPHLRTHAVPVRAEDLKGIRSSAAAAMEAAGPVDYLPFTRVLKAFTVTEVVKSAPANPSLTMEAGCDILVSEPMDSVAFTEHLCEELARVHGIDFFESPVVGSYASEVTDYDGADSLILFLSAGIRRVSEEEELAPGLEEGRGGCTLVVNEAWEGPTRLSEIRGLMEADPDAALPPLI